MPTCPHCHSSERQNRAGQTAAGSQRYRCCFCQRKYTPDPKLQGCAPAVRRRAVQWYVDGMNLRRIGRHLGVHHQSVANWVKAHAEQLPPAPVPASVETAELDELFTFVENKKTRSTS
jgi:transposase-like protein